MSGQMNPYAITAVLFVEPDARSCPSVEGMTRQVIAIARWV